MSKTFLKLFQAIGIEAEYMVVNNISLNIEHGVEGIMRDFNKGEITDYVELGEVAISNELVDHVIEFKGKAPLKTVSNGDILFHKAICDVMANLHKNGLTLLGSAMHPWMNPLEMKLWPFGQNEIYQTYDRIFGCQGHGWCNLQSVHINLPFADEKEFTKLHHAVRLIMPLIPRLAAASPVFEGKLGALPTNRLKFYENNQRKVPSITGKVIPPAHQDYASYYQMLEGMFQEIKPHDPEGVLSGPWLNSHGAIAKFDVQAIEIRIMDIQECPLMDFAIVQFVELLLKNLLSGLWGPIEKFSQINTDLLRTVYDNANSWQDQILPLEYSNLFSSQKNRSINLNTLLQCLFEDVRGKMDQRYAMAISFLLTKGNLSQRIKSQLAPTIERQQLHQIYQQLQHCLQNNVPFLWNS